MRLHLDIATKEATLIHWQTDSRLPALAASHTSNDLQHHLKAKVLPAHTIREVDMLNMLRYHISFTKH